MYHPSTTHNYCMIPPSVKKIDLKSSPHFITLFGSIDSVSIQPRTGGGYSHFFLKKTPKILKFKILNPPKNTLHMYENIRVHHPPSEHLRPTSGTPFGRRFDGRSMVVRFSLLTAYRTWWYWAVYICPFSVIVVN